MRLCDRVQRTNTPSDSLLSVDAARCFYFFVEKSNISLTVLSVARQREEDDRGRELKAGRWIEERWREGGKDESEGLMLVVLATGDPATRSSSIRGPWCENNTCKTSNS